MSEEFEENLTEGLMAAGYTPEEVTDLVRELADIDGDEAPPQLDHPQLRDTGNGPSVSYEEALLAEFYGPPDGAGVYGKGATNG